MNVLIVEDEKLAARKLTSLLQRVAPHAEVRGVTTSIANTVRWIADNRLDQQPEPDIIFMDIELADGQSFEIFSRIDIKSVVIFTTSYDEYALKAFKVKSIDYLLKPVQAEDLQRSLQKYRELTLLKGGQEERMFQEHLERLLQNLRLSESAEYQRRFLVKQGVKMISVEVPDIAYFFIEESVCFFRNHQGQKFIVDYSIDELEQNLDPRDFFRINRGFIVSHQSVAQMQSYFNNRLVLSMRPSHEKEVIVSRDRVSEFKKWMGKW